MSPDSPSTPPSKVARRHVLAAGAAAAAGLASSTGPLDASTRNDSNTAAPAPVVPPESHLGKRRILLACKLGMIAAKEGERTLSLVERLRLAADAGFDGVDFDQAGGYSPEQVREAVVKSGVFVHNAINHAHWQARLTSPDADVRAKGRANIEHCIRVSHAAGGSGVLIVVGHGNDGTVDETTSRCREEIERLLPLAAALGQSILVENVWNRMFYDHDRGPEQKVDRFVEFIDSFHSPWVGLYYDIGNHWKYGRPGDWIRGLGHRCVKLDVKGFNRARNKFTDIGEGDLPWDEVRQALREIGYTGWATAEVKGGGLERLTKVRHQMETVLGLA